MVLAAGLGTRMRPITDSKPKPLVEVGGKTLVDHVLDKLAEGGIAKAVVNVHHHADQMEAHLAGRTSPAIEISDERDRLLDSGGGVVKALPRLAGDAVFILNADTFWLDGASQNVERMREVWDPARMDALLLVAALTASVGFDGAGDFFLSQDGRLRRRPEREVTPFAYAGVAIMSRAAFANAPEGPFSLNRLWNEAIEADRLFGLRLDGLWLHVGTPQAILEAEEAIAASAA
ncbi:nucleotidyltransferase family protein [Chenggangzhangella methanolivorans]|uniref:Nucleotidyltransferase family protein n=1 Tax=Chenggangzhangella methanolivorans TaxID=1437009 RepID=A0A9E6RDC2_9HYPH|nr:nucleotidyltransferase family protein [Chenggangzhangella methanolivorans]QZO02290.1 nucleotidyltransferase family protein [Chenggangzhangella methanolivorans]